MVQCGGYRLSPTHHCPDYHLVHCLPASQAKGLNNIHNAGRAIIFLFSYRCGVTVSISIRRPVTARPLKQVQLVQVARERCLCHSKASAPQLTPQVILALDERTAYQLSYRIVTFQLHRLNRLLTLGFGD
jgi:hypothetical protein